MDGTTDSLVRIDRHPGVGTLRSFGLAIGLVCGVRFAWSWWMSQPAVLTCGLGLVAIAAACARPEWLRAPYVLLATLTFPVRWLLAFTVIAVLYFLLITPVAVAVRLVRRMRGSPAPEGWRVSPTRGDKHSYFRQF
jgi:hypothetical protein